MSAESSTPVLLWEEETGYLVLQKGECRQVFCRIDDEGNIYVWWRRDKKEYPVTLTEFVEEWRKAVTKG